MRKIGFTLASIATLAMLSGCAAPPYDYTNFKEHQPRSILVLPPTNQSPDAKATYGYLSTMSMPIAEKGFYVYPVMLVDEYMKENGLPTANEMQSVPLGKIQEVFGADAVLYTDITKYGTKYEIINSVTEVSATGKLVDVRTGTTIWEGSTNLAQGVNSAASANPIAALIAAAITSLVKQIVSSSTDEAHKVSTLANVQLFQTKDHGLLDGPYSVQR